MYDATTGRFLQRDPAGYADSMDLYSYVRNNPTDGVDPYGYGAEWSRKLDAGPVNLKNGTPDYDIRITHVLPDVPKGATQVWQVVKCTDTWVSGDCKVETETSYVVDIVGIGKKKEIDDTLRWRLNKKVCFAVEQCTHTIGFDDQRKGDDRFDEQTNVTVSAKDAKDLLRDMKGPKGTFNTEYIYKNAKNCKCCSLFLLPGFAAIREGEYLSVGGVGSWKS